MMETMVLADYFDPEVFSFCSERSLFRSARDHQNNIKVSRKVVVPLPSLLASALVFRMASVAMRMADSRYPPASQLDVMVARGSRIALAPRQTVMSAIDAYREVLQWHSCHDAGKRLCAYHAKQSAVTKEVVTGTSPAKKAATPKFTVVPKHRTTKGGGASDGLEGLSDAQRKLLKDLEQREITPEDYDLLRLLDEALPKKAIDRSILQRVLRSEPCPEETTCSICMEDIEAGTTVSTLPCEHRFHRQCVEDWLLRKPACPMCSLEFD